MGLFPPVSLDILPSRSILIHCPLTHKPCDGSLLWASCIRLFCTSLFIITGLFWHIAKSISIDTLPPDAKTMWWVFFMGLSYGLMAGETHNGENENKKKNLFDIYAGLFGHNAYPWIQMIHCPVINSVSLIGLFSVYTGLFWHNAKAIPMDTNDALPFDAQCLFNRSLFRMYRSLLTNAQAIPTDTNDALPFDAQCLF